MAIVLDTPVAVRRAAMDLLARREHGRAELSRKLRQRGASAELIDPTLDRLLPQDAREKAQQGRFLAYRGYSMESISRLLNGRSDD